MQSYLIENPGVLSLDANVFTEADIYNEEVIVKGGGIKDGGDGRIDLIANYSNEYIGIIELKKDRLSLQHLKQLEAYLAQKEEIHNTHNDIIDPKTNNNPNWVGVLAGA